MRIPSRETACFSVKGIFAFDPVERIGKNHGWLSPSPGYCTKLVDRNEMSHLTNAGPVESTRSRGNDIRRESRR